MSLRYRLGLGAFPRSQALRSIALHGVGALAFLSQVVTAQDFDVDFAVGLGGCTPDRVTALATDGEGNVWPNRVDTGRKATEACASVPAADFDGDGQVDVEEAEAAFTFPETGCFLISLRVEKISANPP